MAGYGNYYNSQQFYQPTQQQYPSIGYPQTAQPTRNHGIIWVQGEAGAKSQYVPSGTSELFLDSEELVFYIKTVDASGMPLPLRIFDFKERVSNSSQEEEKVDVPEYVTREEFEKKISELMSEKKITSTTAKKGSKK